MTGMPGPFGRSAVILDRRSILRGGLWASLGLTVAPIVAAGLPATRAVASTSVLSTLNIVAHEDDDLLFLSPDLLHDVQSGRNVRTVYVTAGDDNMSATYWSTREAGIRAAYATMAGVANSWTTVDAGVGGHAMPLETLTAAPAISIVFMRLPDGQIDGAGGSSHAYASLQKLYQGTISSIATVDATSTYTLPQVITVLAGLMAGCSADTVRTLDYAGSFGDGDHSDHHAVAYLAQAASAQYTATHSISGYLGYPVAAHPVNVSGTDLATKTTVFLAYTALDSQECKSIASCSGWPEATWWPRQYVSASSTVTAPVVSVPVDVALTATATASSQNLSTGQTAAKAIDGIIDGYPGSYTNEWATQGGGTGSWLTLTWPTPLTLDQVVLHDRPNTNDQITAGTLTFSDGTTVAVGTLPNDGTAATISFTARTTSTLTLTVTAVSSTTVNVGLSELQAFHTGG